MTEDGHGKHHVSDAADRQPEPPAGTEADRRPVAEEPGGECFLPDAADPDVSPAEARERIGSAGGGPYTPGGAEARPYEG